MKLSTNLFFLILLFSACKTKGLKDLAIQAAAECINASEQKDWDKVVAFSSPLKVKEFGGKDKMIEILKQQKLKGKAEIELGQVEEIKIINGTVYARLFYNVLGEFKTDKFRIDMIGVSKDNGKTWWFIDGPLHVEQFKKYLPDLVGKMKVPTMLNP